MCELAVDEVVNMRWLMFELAVDEVVDVRWLVSCWVNELTARENVYLTCGRP